MEDHLSNGVLLQATQHAGDDYAKMIQGDPGMEDIYYWGPEGPRVSTRGRTGDWPCRDLPLMGFLSG